MFARRDRAEEAAGDGEETAAAAGRSEPPRCDVTTRGDERRVACPRMKAGGHVGSSCCALIGPPRVTDDVTAACF